MSLHLEIVTPEDRVYDSAIDSVVIPAATGEMGILPGHIPVVAQLEAGELQVSNNGKTESLIVGRGFARVEGDVVSILAESAIHEEHIDEKAVEEAVARAEKALAEAPSDHGEVERLEGILRFATAQLTIRRRKR
ncbi:MAG: ATP synthase F1 subunit epsilon [Opitutaceae bacterium]|nr:ATP synthase F1 subunit epsilon [Opitutaceae bacterium]